ncbi:MAG: hypothetical protein MRY74_17155 [Neomegalonema sp.]|nr:hypothetical protein [Neomegalonema sp.]
MGLVKKSSTATSAAPKQKLTRDEVARLLRSADPMDRRRGAEEALNVQDGGVLVAEAIGVETSGPVLERMALSLGDLIDGRTVDAVIEHLNSESAAIRNIIIDLLSEHPDLLVDRMPKLLRRENVDFRIMLVNASVGMKSPKAMEHLCDALPRETDDNVCGAILEALTERGEGRKALDAAEAAMARFAENPFLAFAAKLARDRIATTVRKGNG